MRPVHSLTWPRSRSSARYFEPRSEYDGLRVIWLSYELEAAPAGNELRFALDRVGAILQTDAGAAVELAVPLSSAPSAVSHHGSTRAEGPDLEDLVPTPISQAASLAAFRMSAGGSYFYDPSAQSLLYLQASEEWTVIQR